ncbi:hypothetical protein [Nitrososphaera viennensis]|uniref:Uncharacterized protein n=2 Tax=Nitrososphaera viennensis TaxID=1034015 RepID=A0A060HJF5_9ARCH|nr:hypothetical protein [Nitrososphaera viennensis]AIC15658.1 hypothetical protein NVIE_014180 [Nitrososphaera viennensis EN76]UVS70531.1 hypothetical protein NWT39_07035 [Nitrososphaera viennensis]
MNQSAFNRSTARKTRKKKKRGRPQQAIANKAPVGDVKKMVDEAIGPNLQTAYGIQVVPEFPAPLLLSVDAIAAVAAITRYRKGRFRSA